MTTAVNEQRGKVTQSPSIKDVTVASRPCAAASRVAALSELFDEELELNLMIVALDGCFFTSLLKMDIATDVHANLDSIGVGPGVFVMPRSRRLIVHGRCEVDEFLWPIR